MHVRKEIEALLEVVRKHRRHLHMYPETGLETYETKQYLMSVLSAYDCITLEEGYVKNGLVAYLKVKDTDSCIAFRSDIDALKIKEENDVEYASKKIGYSHACGHDGHMSILLGTIQYLVENKHKLNENILFIFQPGEESPGGAKTMLENGLFKNYNVRYVFGLHLIGDIEKGKIGGKAGPVMARNGEMKVHIHGKSAHGAMPHLGNDAIVAAASMIMQLQTIVSRSIDPLKSTVLTIGTIHGGQVHNAISDSVEFDGSLRSFYDETYMLQIKRIHEIAKATEMAYGVKVDVEIIDFYNIVNNDAYLNDLLQEVCKEDYVCVEPTMASEDFSFYQKEAPGLYFFVGVKDEEHVHNVHHCCFNFDESALLNAIETNVGLLEKLGVYHD